MDLDNIGLTIDEVDFWGPHEVNYGGMRIYWSSKIGFGTCDIVKRDVEGRKLEPDELGEYPKLVSIFTADSECMGEDFVKKLMDLFYEKLKIFD